MKWPQFELWRLFAATALFGVGFALFAIAWRAPSARGDLIGTFAVVCFGAAIGMPFRRGLVGTMIGAVVAILEVLHILFVPFD
jgi:hypothetical protein